jgi:hypothetical protein
MAWEEEKAPRNRPGKGLLKLGDFVVESGAVPLRTSG